MSEALPTEREGADEQVPDSVQPEEQASHQQTAGATQKSKT